MRAADDVTPEECIGVTENGCIGDGMKACQRCALLVRETRRVDHHQLPEDRRSRRKRSGVFQYILEGQIVVPCKSNPVCQGLHLVADFLLPILFNGRITDHHCYIFGVRQSPEDVLEGRKIVDRDRDNGVTLGKNGIPNATLVHDCQNAWASWETAAAGDAEQTRPQARQCSQSGRVGVWQRECEDTRRTRVPGFHRAERAATEGLFVEVQPPS